MNIDKIITDISQRLHNLGISTTDRLDIIINYIKTEKTDVRLTNDEYILLKKLNVIINNSRNDILQQVFMLLGQKVLKQNFNQFYTPFSICKFFGDITSNVNSVLEPSCGTGDLIMNITSKKYILRDIDSSLLDILKLNLKIHNIDENKCDIKIEDSLANIYDFGAEVAVINPPFGIKTCITDKAILDKYSFTMNKVKQQIGLLFIEKSLKELKDDGILYAILPSGYLSSGTEYNIRKFLIDEYRVFLILNLPQNTFKRSGTGVDTCIVGIQKTKMDENYEILIEDIKHIGYDLTKSKTPYLYKINECTGEGLVDEDGFKILKNDLDILTQKINFFANKNKIKYLNQTNNQIDYKSIMKTDIVNSGYNMTITKYWLVKNNESVIIADLKSLYNNITKKEIVPNKDYLYLSIKEINTGSYNTTNILKGWNLPSRATYEVQKNDIIVSKLKGKTSYCIIADDFDNIITTNGVFVIRLLDETDRNTLFYNLINNNINTQINMLSSGSIMASLNEYTFKNKISLIIPTDTQNCYIDKLIKCYIQEHKLLLILRT